MNSLQTGLIVLLGFAVTACQDNNNDSSPAQTPENSAETDHGTAASNEAAAFKIELPAFPDLPTPLEELSPDTQGELTFHTKSPYNFSVLLNDFENAEATTGLGHLYLPENITEVGVPAMVILPGSGGIQEGREHDYGELLSARGIAGFVVDYYTPRGVTEDTPYTLKTMAATEVDVIVDAYSALNFLNRHPAIDANRIGVMGFSYGGMATRYALDPRLKDIMSPDNPPFAAHADFYGPCHQTTGNSATTGAAYLAVFGDKDNSVDPAACEVVHQKIADQGGPTEIHLIEGAGHSWDIASPQTEFPNAYIRGCEFTFEKTTGDFLINGEAAPKAPAGATRNERAIARVGMAELAGPCIGIGYLIGHDAETDQKAKAILYDFLERHFDMN